MRCYNCKGHHDTVADVRDCHDQMSTIRPVSNDNPFDGITVPTDPHQPARPAWPASQKQIDYVIGLQGERLLPDGYVVKQEGELALMERDEVSAEITMLRSFPKDPAKGSASQRVGYTMPEGRYALHDASGWLFYEVTRSNKPRWKGYTFIKRLVGKPGIDYKRVDMSVAHRKAALDAIEHDPKKAMIDYGLQSRHCGRCGSALSNDDKPHPHDGLTSIERGIGPVCMMKDGWF